MNRPRARGGYSFTIDSTLFIVEMYLNDRIIDKEGVNMRGLIHELKKKKKATKKKNLFCFYIFIRETLFLLLTTRNKMFGNGVVVSTPRAIVKLPTAVVNRIAAGEVNKKHIFRRVFIAAY